MSLSPKELEIVNDALAFAKANRNAIAIKYTNKKDYLPEVDPVSIFMAGSPGAGKTETSISLIKVLGIEKKFNRIDPDDLRSEFQLYNGSNSYLFQRAVSILVERLHDKVLQQKQSFILDGTLSNLAVARKNISRSLKRKRQILIYYCYQDPILAWQFVLKREKVEGRKILINDFINQYFSARNVVNKLKEIYENKINIFIVERTLNEENLRIIQLANNIDSHIAEKYTYTMLYNKLLSE